MDKLHSQIVYVPRAQILVHPPLKGNTIWIKWPKQITCAYFPDRRLQKLVEPQSDCELSRSEGITGIFYNSYQSEFRSFNKVGHFSKRWKMGIFTKQTNERRTFPLDLFYFLLAQHPPLSLLVWFDKKVWGGGERANGRIKASVKVFAKPSSYLRFLPVPSLFLLSMHGPLQVPMSPEYTTNANHHHFEDHHIHDHDTDSDHPLLFGAKLCC